MAQNNSGWVVGAAVVGAIALAGASGAFNGQSGSTSATYPASYPSQAVNTGYGSQPVYTGYDPGCYGATQPTYADPSNDEFQRMEEERINAEYAGKVAAIEAEQEAWNRYVIEHPAVGYGNPYDQ